MPLLVHDGMVGYGFAWDDGAQHEEVFIDDHKELTVLTSKPKAVEDSLARYGLARIDGLDFISEHSHGHLNLEEPADLSPSCALAHRAREHNLSTTDFSPQLIIFIISGLKR
ncbi:MAG: hypothetical protein M0C28_45735 [Candidatus Moduliflexus flocculans]|nr:hypothetical protein [Candidatus Moduliflexus flocculans]